MAINFGLAKPDNGFDYLETLRALGQQQALKQDMASQAQRQQIQGYQFNQQRQQDQARPQILQQAQAGNIAGAQRQAFAVGDFDAAKMVQSLDEQKRGQLAQQMGTLGRLATSLIRLPQEQRAQAFAAVKPMLHQQGFDPALVDAADLSDGGLQQYIAAAAGTDDAIKNYYKSTQPTEVSSGATLVNPQTGEVVYQAPTKPDWQFDSESGSWLQKPGTGTAGYAAGGGGPASSVGTGRGANALSGNNPGGINDGAFARSQPGYVGANGRFAGFATLQDGVNAQKALLKSYIDRGYDTPAKIARRWAPAADGNDPRGYAGNIASMLGISPNAKLTAADVDRLQDAQARQENAMYPQAMSRAGSAPAAGGQPSVINVRAPKQRAEDKQYRMLSPQEAQQRGLDPSTKWQVSPQGQIAAIPAKGDKPLTESQSKSVGYLQRAVEAQSTLNTVSGYKPNIAAENLDNLASGNPLRGSLSQTDRRALSGARAFISAILRQESGAAIGAEEFRSAYQTYFPLPGDGPEVQADKRRQREAAIRALRTAAGPGSDSVARVRVNPNDRNAPENRGKIAPDRMSQFKIVRVR